MKIYVASSWRNIRQPEVVERLRSEGHVVYDYRVPVPGDNGFHWSEVDGGYKTEVILIPAPEPKHYGHQIRVATNKPPQWFSEFARRYMRSSVRFPRLRPNMIKRADTLRALEELAKGEAKTVYAQRWLREIKRRLANELSEVPF